MSSNSITQEKVRAKRSLLSSWPKWLRGVVLAVVVLAIGAGSYFAIKARQAKTAASQTSTLQTATARQGNLVLQASGTGYLVASSEANIAFEIDGKLASLNVALGDKVEKGQLLAKLDDASLQYKLEEAQLALLELTSPEAIANAELAVTTAEANVITAQSGVNNQQYWKNDALIQDYYAKFVMTKDNLDRAQAAYERANVGEYINNSGEAALYQAFYNAQQKYNTAQFNYSLYSQKPTQRQFDAAQATLDLAKAKLTNAQNYTLNG